MLRTKVTPLKRWMLAATPQEQEALATRAGTSRDYLFHHVAEGRREARPELAAAVEKAAAALHKATKGRLPRLYRTDMAPACAACPYARECLGSRNAAKGNRDGN